MSMNVKSDPSPTGMLVRDASGAPKPVESRPSLRQMLSSSSSVKGFSVMASKAKAMRVYAWFEYAAFAAGSQTRSVLRSVSKNSTQQLVNYSFHPGNFALLR